ncbi:MAG: hypothetical protein ACKVQB_12690 [Bacteroidia bacterium]
MSRIHCPNCSHHSYHIAMNNDGKPSHLLVGKVLLKLGYIPSFIRNFPIQCNTCSYSWKA